VLNKRLPLQLRSIDVHRDVVEGLRVADVEIAFRRKEPAVATRLKRNAVSARAFARNGLDVHKRHVSRVLGRRK
jgi:hypothetical protein